jgi:hypothetical protein
VDVLPPQAGADDATAVLRDQMDNLRKATERQWQHESPSLDEAQAAKLDQWRQAGLSEGDARFLARHPRMVDMHELAQHAAGEALRAGHTGGTDAFYDALKANFDRHLAEIERQSAPPGQQAAPMIQPSPALSDDEPTSELAASLYSAPVTRNPPGGSYAPSLNSVTLSPEERQIAKASGLTEKEYAYQKLKMLRAKSDGSIQP